jgi:hypothetical protein
MSRRKNSRRKDENSKGEKGLNRQRRAAASRPEDNPLLRTIRLTDDSFASRLFGKYGWSTDASFRRGDMVHRRQDQPAEQPPLFQLHVSLFMRQIRLLLQPYIGQRLAIREPAAPLPDRASGAIAPQEAPETRAFARVSAQAEAAHDSTQAPGTAFDARLPETVRTQRERLRLLIQWASRQAGASAVIPLREIPAAFVTGTRASLAGKGAEPIVPLPPQWNRLTVREQVHSLMILHQAFANLRTEYSMGPAVLPPVLRSLIRPELKEPAAPAARAARFDTAASLQHLRQPSAEIPPWLAMQPAVRRTAGDRTRPEMRAAIRAMPEPRRLPPDSRAMDPSDRSFRTDPVPAFMRTAEHGAWIESARWLERLETYSLHVHLAGQVFRTFDADLVRPALVRWMQALPVQRILGNRTGGTQGRIMLRTAMPETHASGTLRLPSSIPFMDTAMVRQLHAQRATVVLPQEIRIRWRDASGAPARPVPPRAGQDQPEEGHPLAGVPDAAVPVPGSDSGMPFARAVIVTAPFLPPAPGLPAPGSDVAPGRGIPLAPAAAAVLERLFRTETVRPAQIRMLHAIDRTGQVWRVLSGMMMPVSPGRPASAPRDPLADRGIPATPAAALPAAGPSGRTLHTERFRFTELRMTHANDRTESIREELASRIREIRQERVPEARAYASPQMRMLVRLQQRILPQLQTLQRERWLERIQSRVFGESVRRGLEPGQAVRRISFGSGTEPFAAPVHVRERLTDRTIERIAVLANETVRAVIRQELPDSSARTARESRRVRTPEHQPVSRFLPAEWRTRIIEHLRTQRILEQTIRMHASHFPLAQPTEQQGAVRRAGDLQPVQLSNRIVPMPVASALTPAGRRNRLVPMTETAVRRNMSLTEQWTMLHSLASPTERREQDGFRPVHAMNRQARPEDRPAHLTVSRRPVTDVVMEVAHPPARFQARLEPDLRELRAAIQNVEKDLNEAKAAWNTPKMDFNKLADNMYREFARRIRFEQQRRGL